MPKKKEIKVKSHVESGCKPELVRLTLTLYGRDSSMAAASERLCRNVDAAVDRLEKSGFKREDIRGGVFRAEESGEVCYDMSVCFRYNLGKLRGLLQTIGVSLPDCRVRVELLLNDLPAKLENIKDMAVEKAFAQAQAQSGEDGELGKLQSAIYENVGQTGPLTVCDAPAECFRHGSIPFGIGGYSIIVSADVECTWKCKF